MERNAYNDLLAWKNKANRKPLLVFGARQVGKTYLIKEFCENEYNKTHYFNLTNQGDLIDIFENNKNASEAYTRLKILLDNQIEENDVLFIDEVQEAPRFLTQLKFFNEEHPELNIICAGSLLGTMLNRSGISFPVGQVDYLYLNAMSFDEYLLACNKTLKEEIDNCFKEKRAMYNEIHELALKEYRNYLCLGGMPASIKNYLDNDKDLSKHDTSIIDNIINDYKSDMSKYINNNFESIKLRNVYDSLSTQLLNTSNKFQYSKIDRNARKREYIYAIDWLRSSRLVLECNSIKQPLLPFKAYLNDDPFKLYLSDVGILTHLLEISYLDILDDKLSAYKGAISENYVAFHLNNNNIRLLFLRDGHYKVDFIIRDKKGNIIPIEVKYALNTKSVSLNNYINKYKPEYAIRISSKNFGFDDNVISIPLYAVYLIDRELSF